LAAGLLVAALLTALPAAAAPRCFGAASRDPERPCRNPKLRKRVTPRPDKALITPNVACAKGVEQAIEQCSYGADPDEATATVVLLGDSHAAHWRGALKVVGNRMRWHVSEFAAPHCPFSTAVPDTSPEEQEGCRQLNADIVEWLEAHPEVATAFVSNHTRAPIKVPEGQSKFETRVAGFVEQWRRLPASVQHLIVLHDTPLNRLSTFDCVRKAMRHHRPAGAACTVRRDFALPPDAGEVAAERIERSADTISMAHQFCGPRRCFPVVGGVLVNKDVDHLGQLYARTLGPILLRRVRNLLAGYGLQS
jgi:hypothetical protein